jgi:hypothetical protein
MRYLPSFCGRWEIELYPNWDNLVVLPVHPAANNHIAMNEFGTIQATDEWKTQITKSFTQLGEEFTMIDSCTYLPGAGGTITRSGAEVLCGTTTVTTANAANCAAISVPTNVATNDEPVLTEGTAAHTQAYTFKLTKAPIQVVTNIAGFGMPSCTVAVVAQ